MKKECITKFNSNFGPEKGVKMLSRFFESCILQDTCRTRDYTQGLQSLFNDNTKNTTFNNGVLTSAEGFSPRLLLMR